MSIYIQQTVVRHLGTSANSGHYITDVRTVEEVDDAAGGGKAGESAAAAAAAANDDAKQKAEEKKKKKMIRWKRYDDSVVSKVSHCMISTLRFLRAHA